jgi:hypothetical protein
MVVDDEQLPTKPNFSALSAQEQAGGKVEFRRVSSSAAAAAAACSPPCLLQFRLQQQQVHRLHKSPAGCAMPAASKLDW